MTTDEEEILVCGLALENFKNAMWRCRECDQALYVTDAMRERFAKARRAKGAVAPPRCLCPDCFSKIGRKEDEGE